MHEPPPAPAPPPAPRTARALALMTAFAARTGASSDRPQRRYLWTDAFAVCNLLGLARATGDGAHAGLALALVDRVHHALGRHRDDDADARAGWISGLAEAEGEAHPTCGGLRIGKPLPERAPDEPLDARLEWDRDGQYFHYLTKWMHALDQAARATGEARFNVWARELAAAAHRAFARAPRGGGGPTRMYWKMSVDLSRPLVASMGHHDPLDGFVTCAQLDATAALLGAEAEAPSLARATQDFASMLDLGGLATDDPLGLGGLLLDAARVAQLLARAAVPNGDAVLAALLDAARVGLDAYLAPTDLRAPAHHRLAFRELGLAIGLAAVASLPDDARSACGARARAGLAALAGYSDAGDELEAFWLRDEHRATRAWREHEDINDVMLATRLLPDGFARLLPPPPAATRARG